MVTEGGRLRRRSPACTSGAAAEAQERRLRWGGSGAEGPLALRVFGGRSTACAAGGLGRRSTACPAEGGSGAGAPLALRGGSGAGISHGLRRDDTSQEPRLRPEGGGWAYEAGLRSGGWGAGAPLLLRELLGSRCSQPSAPPRATTDVGQDRAAADKGAARYGVGCSRGRCEQPPRARRAPGDAHEAHSPASAPGAGAPHPYCRTSSSTSVVSRSRVWRSRASTLRRRRGSVLDGRRLNHQSGVVTVRPSRVSVVAAGWSA